MPVEMIGIKTLYDICFSFPENYDDFMLELIEKSTKLLGASRIALISGEGEQRRCLVSRGFSGEREIYECIIKPEVAKKKIVVSYILFQMEPLVCSTSKK
jgi:hypothetical protein